jgi:hypothetical protein
MTRKELHCDWVGSLLNPNVARVAMMNVLRLDMRRLD